MSHRTVQNEQFWLCLYMSLKAPQSHGCSQSYLPLDHRDAFMGQRFIHRKTIPVFPQLSALSISGLCFPSLLHLHLQLSNQLSNHLTPPLRSSHNGNHIQHLYNISNPRRGF